MSDTEVIAEVAERTEAARAKPSSRTVDINGEVFMVPTPGDIPYLFWEYYRQGDLKAAWDYLLDDDDESERLWLRARPTTKRLVEVANVLAEDMGVDLGKSTAPSTSQNGASSTSTPTSGGSGA